MAILNVQKQNLHFQKIRPVKIKIKDFGLHLKIFLKTV